MREKGCPGVAFHAQALWCIRMTTEKHHITTTERAANSFEVVLRQWFSARVGAADPVDLTVTERPDSVGFSSASVIFDVVWMQDGARRSGSFVARMAPEATAMAVFPRYDMAEQFELLRTVSELSDVPVPRLHWMEPDASVLGTPFFVMERAHGLVPPDNLPYVFDGWLLDATSPQRQRLQDSSVEVLAKTHAIVEPESRFAALCPPTRCVSTSTRNAPTTGGRWPMMVSASRSLSAPSSGWSSTGRPNPDRTCSAGVMPESATSCTKTSNRWRCSTGRWPRSVPASWIWACPTTRTTSSCTGRRWNPCSPVPTPGSDHARFP